MTPTAWLDDGRRSRLDTPRVVVDLDRVDAQHRAMAAFMRDRGVALRPHAKTHKSVEVARRQIAAGAVGLTVATIGEAEVFAECRDRGPVHRLPGASRSGPRRSGIRRLAARCRLSVGADFDGRGSTLAATCRVSPSAAAVLIEIDSGGRAERRPPGACR